MGPKRKIAVMHRANIAWVIKGINKFSGKTCRDFDTCHMVVLKRPAQTTGTVFTTSTALKTTFTAYTA